MQSQASAGLWCLWSLLQFLPYQKLFGASKMVEWVKAHAAKPEKLGSVPGSIIASLSNEAIEHIFNYSKDFNEPLKVH